MKNRFRNQVAIVGVGSTEYGRRLDRTHLSLGLEASVRAIEDAGIDKQEVDGICGSGWDVFSVGDATYLALQGGLGIDETSWVLNSWLSACFVYGAEAVASGMCDTVLVVQANRRGSDMSRSANDDPFRHRAAQFIGKRYNSPFLPERWYHTGEAYAGWMAHYMDVYQSPAETFGYIAVNNRTHASRHPNAVMKTPITMDDYLGSRPIWEPMKLLDMDVPADCGEALVMTTAERARDLSDSPIYVHAATLGGSRVGRHYEAGISWTELSSWVSMKSLWARTDLTVSDVDIFFPYDGYTVGAVHFTEAAGFCGAGEAHDLYKSSWDSEDQTLRLNGRTYVSTNGGSLSQGRAGGFNYFSEAARQLRGNCGDRQVANAKTALIGAGSFYHDPVGVLLTSEPV